MVAGQRTMEEFGDRVGCGDEFRDAQSGLNAHAVEQVDEVFGGEIAGCAGGIRAAAESAGGSVEGGDAHVQPGGSVGEGGPISVMKM